MNNTNNAAAKSSEITTQDAVTVSIIIPAFNAADSIGRCVSSVIRQRLPGSEIIIIDDGSRDGTSDLVGELMRAYPTANIRSARQANQGVSVARNHGLALARGRYVMFIDADDRLADEALEAMWVRAEIDRLDVLLCNAWWHDLAGRPPRPMLGDSADWVDWSRGRVGTGRDWITQRVAERRLKHYVWCQFIRRDWLVRLGLHFVPGITHQDIVWTNQLLGRARRVGFTPQPVYHYHQRAGSLSQPRDSAARLRTARHYMRVASELDGLVRATSNAPLRAAYAWQAVEEGIAVLHAARHLTSPDRERLYRLVQSSAHTSLLLRNALGPGHKLRVLKRCLRYFAWRAGEALLQLARSGPAPSRQIDAGGHINTQFGAD